MEKIKYTIEVEVIVKKIYEVKIFEGMKIDGGALMQYAMNVAEERLHDDLHDAPESFRDCTSSIVAIC